MRSKSIRAWCGQLPGGFGRKRKLHERSALLWWKRLLGQTVCFVRRGYNARSGQGTVEFALITAGFLVVVFAFASLWRTLEGGLFVEHALMSASHHLQMTIPGAMTDVFLY